MHLHPATSSMLLLFTLACEVGGGDDTTSNESEESGAPVASCEDQLEQAACEAVDNAGEGCVWAELERAVRTGDSCMIQKTNLCFDDDINDSAAGCVDLEGCEASLFAAPFYRIEGDGSVLLLDQCGGTAPQGFAACSTGTVAADDPPECACVCELAPG